LSIEIISRAFIQRGEKVLVAHKKGASNTFLPGGHVEFGEASDAALGRELAEELGVNSRVGEFIGLLEYKFFDGSLLIHEINIVFQVNIDEGEVGSMEAGLEFKWIPLEAASSYVLLPEEMIFLINTWLKTGKPIRIYSEEKSVD
jgi:8-oxo-dGTP diphosphatase